MELITKHILLALSVRLFQVQTLSKLQSRPSKIRKTAKIPHKKYNHMREPLTSALNYVAKAAKAKTKNKTRKTYLQCILEGTKRGKS